MLIWKVLYWAAVILYFCAIGLAALIVVLCCAVLLRRLVRRFEHADGKSIKGDTKRANRDES